MYYQGSAWCVRLALRVRGLNLAKRVVLERGMEHPARVEEEREGGTGPRERDRGKAFVKWNAS